MFRDEDDPASGCRTAVVHKSRYSWRKGYRCNKHIERPITINNNLSPAELIRLIIKIQALWGEIELMRASRSDFNRILLAFINIDDALSWSLGTI